MQPVVDYIFCINPGRSGSAYLTRLFRHVAGCVPEHEPEPVGNGRAMRAFLAGHPDEMRDLAVRKVAVIDAARGGQVYVETNHCFIKGFGWFLPDHLPPERIGVVILKRAADSVAASLLRVDCSPLLPLGREWVMTPDIAEPLVPPPRRFLTAGFTYGLLRLVRTAFRGARLYEALRIPRIPVPKWLTSYELECLRWYVAETRARGEEYRRRFDAMKFYDVELAELNTMDGVTKMLDFFGCTALPTMNDVVGRPANRKLAPPA